MKKNTGKVGEFCQRKKVGTLGFSVGGKSPESVNWNDLGYSVTPSLMAWTALLLPS